MAKRNIALENEISANKQMVNVCVVSAIMLLLIWIGYLTGLFKIKSTFLINIFFPICIAICLSTMLWIKTSQVSNPKFKYFLLIQFLIVISVLNVIIPKHATLGYAAVIILTNHYYNPKTGRVLFFMTLFSMLLCIYAGAFVGEYDANLIGEGIIVYNEQGEAYDVMQPDTIKERFDYMILEGQKGNNRFIRIFGYYYMARAIFLTIIFLISNGLNIRTFKLAKEQMEMFEENSRIETELSIAAKIQMSALPKEFLNTKDVQIFSELMPAKEVGGDLYFHKELDKHHIAFLVADVSGKGVPAAMFMMNTITCFRNLLDNKKTPAKVLYEVNNSLCEQNEESMFVTVFLGILNTETGVLQFANAAHNNPLIKHRGRYNYLPCNTGIVLGAYKDFEFTDQAFKMDKGDIITLYTDGVTEAKNTNQELFGEKRFLEFANKQNSSSLIDFHYELKDELNHFTNGEPQSDDITILSVAYRNDTIISSDILVNIDRNQVSELINFANKCVDKYKIPAINKNSLSVIIDEIGANIFKYAYQDINDNRSLYMRFAYNQTKNQIGLTFIDYGIDFNMLEVNNDPIQSIENQKEGGLGILIVKQMTIKQSYNRTNNKNILNLIYEIKEQK